MWFCGKVGVVWVSLEARRGVALLGDERLHLSSVVGDRDRDRDEAEAEAEAGDFDHGMFKK
jgi:hypothetical protein